MIDKYYLMLGQACNLRCIYCCQGQEKPMECDTEVDPKVVASYFPEDSSASLVFYGGEPLLYFDYMVSMAYEIKKRSPNIKLRTVTNGTLLTVDKAIILNDLDISVGVSHDGKSFEQTRRTKDFLKTNPEPYLTLKRRNIGATVTTANPDFYDVWDYFEDFSLRNGTRREYVRIDIARDTNYSTDHKLIITKNNEFEAMLDKVFSNLEKAIREKNWDAYEFTQYLPVMATLNHRLRHPADIGSWCGSDKFTSSIDTHGNIFNCHNTDTVIGHVSEDGLIASNFNPYIKSEKCQSCPAMIVCGGGCAVISKEVHEAHCYVQYQQITKMIKMLERIGGQ